MAVELIASLVVAWANLVKNSIAKADAKWKAVAAITEENLVKSFVDAVIKNKLNPDNVVDKEKLIVILKGEPYNWRGNIAVLIDKVSEVLKVTYADEYRSLLDNNSNSTSYSSYKSIIVYFIEFINWLKAPF